MTLSPPLGSGDMGGPAALRRGFAVAGSQWFWFVGLFALRVLGPFFDLFTWFFLVRWIPRRRASLALVALIFAVSLGLDLLRFLILGSAVYENVDQHPSGKGLLRSSGRSITAFCWLSVIHLVIKLLLWMAVASAAATYLLAWEHPLRRALPASAALAATLTWAVPVTLLAAVWTELAFVESLKTDKSYLASLSVAATQLLRRLWAVSGIYLLTGVLAWVVQVIIAGVANWIAAHGKGVFDMAFVGAGQLTLVILVAMATSFLELARFQAFSALEARPM